MEERLCSFRMFSICVHPNLRSNIQSRQGYVELSRVHVALKGRRDNTGTRGSAANRNTSAQIERHAAPRRSNGRSSANRISDLNVDQKNPGVYPRIQSGNSSATRIEHSQTVERRRPLIRRGGAAPETSETRVCFLTPDRSVFPSSVFAAR